MHLPLEARLFAWSHPCPHASAIVASPGSGWRTSSATTHPRRGLSDAELARVIASEEAELHRRERLYRGDRAFPDVRGRTVILVDDGLATGATMRVAVEALRLEGPARIVVAVPVAAPETCEAFRDVADEVVCAATPEGFEAVGQWYADFSQTTDETVHELLERARRHGAMTPSGDGAIAGSSSR